ncbi:23S rRNA (uracil(1939)-C(5))-methyltransferase RlmD [Alginatibacterium sediminis]|uniref:23S rRNA (Uracil(1939)-C(5))-methyltransferase RlmD n=1 Tax=Alginatibacterium sediminis TaxID=2164068 RepID=A0A420EDA8_9ALTE|nr:23S rRNA (uracil(1939)-C(5))-methyltransferase RlmD [Alginatibacterium sediminis]RKF18612.1 23S rRNA (uracil(1939)-C(5))-methyltransferase RlmD [Alginatibacterium sediminis]
MAQFFKVAKAKKQTRVLKDVRVESLDHHLLGVAKSERNTYFIPQVLPGESIDIDLVSKKHAKLRRINSASELRIEPLCPHYQDCGGCDSQHLTTEDQLRLKAQASELLIKRFSRYQDLPQSSLISSQPWHYRRVTRLSTWFEQHWVLGFRQANSKKICEFESCLVLRPALQAIIPMLRELIREWPKSLGLGHIELIEGDQGVSAKIRTRKAFDEKQNQRLLVFAQQHLVTLSIEDDENQINLLEGRNQYSLLSGKQLQFEAGHFVQVNAQCNQDLVQHAVSALQLKPNDRVLDLFCGLGNFSLDIASHVEQVLAVEGNQKMVQQLQRNAQLNGLDNIDVQSANLQDKQVVQGLFKGGYNKLLLDPARAGAQSIVEILSLAKFAKVRPQIVVYVSCDPATLSRDAALLNQIGYQFESLCFVDMFPQTQHLESVAVFRLL